MLFRPSILLAIGVVLASPLVPDFCLKTQVIYSYPMCILFYLIVGLNAFNLCVFVSNTGVQLLILHAVSELSDCRMGILFYIFCFSLRTISICSYHPLNDAAVAYQEGWVEL